MTDPQPASAADDDPHRAGREVGDAVRRLALEVDAFVRGIARRTDHHTADLHAVGVVKRAAEDGTPLTAGELGRLLGLSPAAVSAMLDRMERADHVIRSRRDTDNRRVYLEPGAASMPDSREHFAELNHAYAEALAPYSPEQLLLVVDVLGRLEEATATATATAEHAAVRRAADLPTDPAE